MFQNDLDETARVWNSHKIRPVRGRHSPHGIPDIMYSIPAIYNTDDCLVRVDENSLDIYNDQCTFRDICPADPDITELSIFLMGQYNWEMPTSTMECVELYLNLRYEIKQRLNF